MNRLLTTCVCLFCLAAFALVAGCSGSEGSFNVEQSKKIAGQLRDNKLFEAAIDEYKQILERGKLDSKQQGNVSFLIGRIYFEDLHDYSNAAAWYVRARAYDENADYSTEAAEKLVASLERIGHSFDAKRELDNAANITKPARQGDVEVARIGSDPIYLSDIEKQIQGLPPGTQQQLRSPDAKKEFVRQYVGVELMYRAAQREGFDKDPEVRAKEDQVLKSLVVQKYMSEKVLPELHIDSADVRNFYAANKAHYGDASYDSVKSQVLMDYQSQKAEAAYGEYIDRLAKAEQVQFMDQNIK